MPAPRLLASWQPAALITGDVIALKLTLGVIALNRAGDYAHGAGDRYHMLESAFPLWVWCVWAYLVGACVLVGIACRRAAPARWPSSPSYTRSSRPGRRRGPSPTIKPPSSSTLRHPRGHEVDSEPTPLPPIPWEQVLQQPM